MRVAPLIDFTNQKRCLVCSSGELQQVIHFGEIPIADKLTSHQTETAPCASLSLWFCESCGHLQIAELLSPQVLFQKNYPYLSSSIPEVAAHFTALADRLISEYGIGRDSSVLEIMSNDGVFLKNFFGITEHILGIEPSEVPARVCESLGVRVITEFFGHSCAERLLLQRTFRYPDLIVASNVLSHVPNPQDFMRGVAALMGESTVAVVEIPYALDMIRNGTFDSIFHQHCSYFTMRSAIELVRVSGLNLAKVETTTTQGGSLRLHITRGGKESPLVNDTLENERKVLDPNGQWIRRFVSGISSHRRLLLELLGGLKAKGQPVAGYGAAGKSCLFLNYYGISEDHLSYLVDISPSKHGKYFPNTGLEIFPVGRLQTHPCLCDNLGMELHGGHLDLP